MKELFVPFNAKGGRPRKFAYPTQMLKAFSDYLTDRMERSITFTESEVGEVGKSTINKDRTTIKHHPLSIADFCIYLGCSREWWAKLPDEFLQVKTYIADYIYTFQLKGAEVGEFNPNIVARELGLADKKQVDMGDNVTIVVKDAEQKEKLQNMASLGV